MKMFQKSLFRKPLGLISLLNFPFAVRKVESAGIFFNMKQNSNKNSDFELSGALKSANLDKIRSPTPVKQYIREKDSDLDKIYLRNQHLGLIQKLVEMQEKLNNTNNQNEIKDFLEIVKTINNQMHFLLLPKDNEETPKTKQKLMNNLLNLQDNALKLVSPVQKEFCFFLNIHFLREILRGKDDLWTHKLLEYLRLNPHLQAFFEEIIDVLSFREIAYLIPKISKKQKELEGIFEKVKAKFLSESFFDEISQIYELNIYFIISQQNSFEISIDKKKILIKFFNILKASESDWALDSSVLNSIISFIKKSCYNFEETLVLLNFLKDTINSSKKGYDFFLSNLSLVRAFANFFPSYIPQKNTLFLEFLQDYFAKNQEFHDFYTMCLCIEFLNEKAFEIPSVQEHITIENAVEFIKKTGDHDFVRFFERLTKVCKTKIYELLFRNGVKNFKDFNLKTNKSILLCYYLNPRDCHNYNFSAESLRQYSKEQFYLNKILSFSCYISPSLHQEFLSLSMKNLLNSVQNDSVQKFIENILYFLEQSDETKVFIKNQPRSSILKIQDRLNNELKEGAIKLKEFCEILRICSHSETIKLSEKYINIYLKQNLYGFSLGQLSHLMYDLSASNQLFPDLSRLLQNFFITRIDFLNSRELKHLVKALNHMDASNINFHFFQSLHEVILSRATNPEYAPLITEYIFNQTKYEKKKQYALQTPINNLMKALKKNTYHMTLNKFGKLLNAFNRINATFTETLKKEIRNLFQDEKLNMEISQISAQEVAFVYVSIFSYAFVEKTSNEMMQKLHEILKVEIALKRVKNFDIGRIISEMTLNYSNIKDNVELMGFLKEILLPKIMTKDFYYMEKIKSTDIGLFVLMFWDLALLQIPKVSTDFINKFGSEIDNLVKQSILFQEKSKHSIHSPTFAKENGPIRNVDLKRSFKNIHLMQMYQAITLFSCFLEGQPEYVKEKAYIDEKLESIKKVDALNKTPAHHSFNNESKEHALDSNFHEKVFFILNEKIFEKKQNIVVEKQFGPFHADIFVDAPYNVIFECNGHQHYKAGKLKLNDIRKYEVFKKIYKMNVVELNYLEWNEKKPEEQINYLKACMKC